MSGPPSKTLGNPSLVKRLGLLVIVAAGLGAFVIYAMYEAQARVQEGRASLTAELGVRADKIQEWLLRVDRTLNWFRAEDFSTGERVSVTVRMLHTERFVAPAVNLMLFSTTGRLVAATLPLPDGGGVATQPWFKAVQGAPMVQPLQISACAHDPFSGGEGVMLYRAVMDHDTVAGYVGSFLPQAALTAMSRDDDPTNGTLSLALLNGSQQVLGCPVAGEPMPAHHHPAGFLRSGLSRVIHAWPALAARSAIRQERLIQPGNLHLIASADALDTVSDEDWVALAYRATYVATSLVIIMALMGSLLHNAGQSRRRRSLAPPATPAADGADWMWELDASGNLVGLAGNAPDHLLPPNGRSLAEAAGPIGSADMRWDRLNAAICGKQAFEGLLIPFQLPGREGLLTIFELSGQPVLASGGFWGTASLMSEESIAKSAEVRVPQQQLSIA